MTGFEAFMSYILSLAAGLTQRLLRIEKKTGRPSSSSTGPLDLQAGRSAAPTADVSFADDSQVRQHRSFFGTTTTGGRSIASVGDPGNLSEEWTVTAKWDASHSVPKRGDGRRTNTPSLVEWNPQGNHVVTACDAFGMTRWRDSGQRIGGGTNESAYGSPERFFWSQDGRLVLLEAKTALNSWWTIQRDDILTNQVVSRGAFWGRYESLGTAGRHGQDRRRFFNPWRPGREQLLLAGYEARLNLLSISDLPKEDSSSTETLDEIPIEVSLGFSNLGAQDGCVFRYHWHPSGQYVAVTTGIQGDLEVRRVHIVHFDKAEIIASIQATTRALGWSSGGRLLWCTRNLPQTTSGSENEEREVVVWDAHSWEVRTPTDEEYSRLPVPWLLFDGDKTSTRGIASCDGKRVLVRKTPVPDGRHGLSILRRDTNKEVFDFPLDGVSDAAWSPTDPLRLATVGGKDAPRMLRIWSLKT